MFNRPALPNPATDPHNAVAVMFSGGIDSTVILAQAIAEGKEVFPIAFDDGSLNFQLRRSVALELTTQSLGVYNRLIVAKIPELEVLRKSTSGFGFIPGMKMLMMVTAMSYCHVLNVDTLLMGYNADNKNGGFLDESEDFMEGVSTLFYYGYGAEKNTDHPFGRRIRVLNPYFDKSKDAMVSLGAQLGVNLGNTISCRQVQVGAGLVHCGECEVCIRRRLSFIMAAVNDPTIWRVGSPCHTHATTTVPSFDPEVATKQCHDLLRLTNRKIEDYKELH